MLYDASIPGSDDWWLVRLGEKLGDGLPRMHKLTSYRDGDALLPIDGAGAGTRESYMRFVRRARLHVVETIRNARTDRQRVIGFRTGAEGDENGDLAAWRLWTLNRMKVQQRQFFNDTADFGRAYLLTAASPDGPLWTVRNEWNTVTEQNALRPWLTQAGVTYGFDQVYQVETLTLFGPGYYRRAVRPSRFATLPQDGTTWSAGNGWEWREDRQATGVPDSLLQQSRTVDGFGVYEKHLDTIDRINEITLNALTIIVTEAFRQRGIKGKLPQFYPEGHPQAGEEIDYDELFKAGPAALWMLGDAAEIWESAVTDVTPIYNARRDEIKVLSSLTNTPQDIFDGDSQNQSAMGAQISREPLYHAVSGMNDQAEVAITQAMATSFLMTGDVQRASITDLETMWAKINPATLSEKAEAVSKMGGKPPQRWIDTEVLEMTPAQQRQAETDRMSDAFTAALSEATTSE